MDDHAFERRLQRLFAEPQPFADAAVFASTVQGRLGRGWAMRRAMIGLAGLVGGLIAVVQVVSSGLAVRFGEAGETMKGLGQGVGQGVRHLPDRLPPGLSAEFAALSDLPFGGEVVWMVMGLAALAIALLAGRAFERL